MKRKKLSQLSFVLCILCCSFIVNEKSHAQFRYSVLGGYSGDSYKSKGIGWGDNYLIGIEGEKSLNTFDAVSLGFYYKRGGYIDKDELEYLQYGIFTDLKSGTLKVDQIIIPIEYRYYIGLRMLYFSTAVEARINANVNISESIYKEDGFGQYSKESYSLNINAYSKRLEPFIAFGFGWNFLRRYKFQTRYCIGVYNVHYNKLAGNIPFSDSDSFYLTNFNGKVKQESIQFLIGVQF